MAAVLPLAAGLDWLEGLLPLLFLLFWIVSQVRNLFRGGDRAAGPVVVRPEPRQPAADELREDLARQIEEFIRRSSGERPPAPPARRPRDRGARPPAPRSVAAPPVPQRQSPPPATGQRPARRDARGSRDTAPAPARPSALGSLGGHAADVSRHVHDAFAHQIEHLPPGLGDGGVPTAAAKPAGYPAADVIAALRDPTTLRQLVIVREVLERPTDRW